MRALAPGVACSRDLACIGQVGYGGVGKPPPPMRTRSRAAGGSRGGGVADGEKSGGAEELAAKQRLARAVRSSVRRDAPKDQDDLKAMGLMP